MTDIRLEAVNKQFKGTLAVEDISFTFADGALTVLVGPSGCGKTTLLRMIAGLETPTSGYIYIGDEVVNDTPAWERNTAMVFQSYALYPHMTVFANMAFPLEARRTPRRDIRAQVEQVAHSLGIANLLQRKPRQLSGGQMQRVALGRAMVRRPHVFLMDEPLSNLDAILRVETRAELKRLQRDLGITMVYVTHDQEEAMTLADTLVVMRDGHMEQAGAPEEVYHQPCSLFVARFIGSPAMNTLSCQYEPATGHLVGAAFRLDAPARFRPALEHYHTATELVLGIRPEHITIHPEQPYPRADADTADSIPAEVYVREPLGRETLFTLKLGPTLLKAAAPPTLNLSLNDSIWLTFDTAALHLFDAESGAALRSHTSQARKDKTDAPVESSYQIHDPGAQ